jgi:membrane protein DedA with SNARE-associated domain
MEFLHLLGSGPALVIVCAFLLVEESGIPIPVPGDAVLMSAGYLAWVHGPGLLLFMPIGYLCAVTGAAICYWVSRKLGRAVIVRHGRKIQITEARLNKAEKLMNRAAARTVGIARMFPGGRINASIAAGCLNVPFKRFYSGVLISSVFWVAGFTLLGYVLGERMNSILPWLDKISIAIVPGFIVIAILEWNHRRQNRHYAVTAEA